MFSGVLALMYRSLRIDSRSLSVHFARFALVVAIYVSFMIVSAWTNSVSAPGLNFLRNMAYLNLTFMSLLGISFFSTAISEEKEEDTLGLMLMAGISPIGILIGKTSGRLIQTLVLIAVQYPFTLLAITLGGVTRSQVNAVYLALLSYLILLAGFGLLCSTLSSNNRTAATRMVFGLVLYTLIPLLIQSILFKQGGRILYSNWQLHLLDRIVSFSVFQQIGFVLTTAFGDSMFSWQVVSNLCAGIGCFIASWRLFGFATRNPSSEAMPRGIVPRPGKMFRRLQPGRVWTNPFVWKDFYFIAGGYYMIVGRLLFCLGLWGLMNTLYDSQTAMGGFQMFLSLAVAIDAGRIMAGSLQSELRGQTLASLVMLPRSAIAVFYAKLAGGLLGWMPGPLVNLLVTLGTSDGWSNFDWNCRHAIGYYVASLFVLIPNLSMLLASYLRWGAVLLGTAVGFGLFFSLVPFFAAGQSQATMASLIAILVMVVCAFCHAALMMRITSLAAK